MHSEYTLPDANTDGALTLSQLLATSVEDPLEFRTLNGLETRVTPTAGRVAFVGATKDYYVADGTEWVHENSISLDFPRASSGTWHVDAAARDLATESDLTGTGSVGEGESPLHEYVRTGVENLGSTDVDQGSFANKVLDTRVPSRASRVIEDGQSFLAELQVTDGTGAVGWVGLGDIGTSTDVDNPAESLVGVLLDQGTIKGVTHSGSGSATTTTLTSYSVDDVLELYCSVDAEAARFEVGGDQSGSGTITSTIPASDARRFRWHVGNPNGANDMRIRADWLRREGGVA